MPRAQTWTPDLDRPGRSGLSRGWESRVPMPRRERAPGGGKGVGRGGLPAGTGTGPAGGVGLSVERRALGSRLPDLSLLFVEKPSCLQRGAKVSVPLRPPPVSRAGWVAVQKERVLFCCPRPGGPEPLGGPVSEVYTRLLKSHRPVSSPDLAKEKVAERKSDLPKVTQQCPCAAQCSPPCPTAFQWGPGGFSWPAPHVFLLQFTDTADSCLVADRAGAPQAVPSS